jgi:hypothetical protein
LKENCLLKFFDEMDGIPKIGLILLSAYIESNNEQRNIRKIQSTEDSDDGPGEAPASSTEIRTSEYGPDVELDE